MPTSSPAQAADEFARDFKCGKDEVKVIGENGPGHRVWQSADIARKALIIAYAPACFCRINVKATGLSA